MSLLLQAASALTDYTSSLLSAVLVLAATACLAYVSLRFGAARGLLGTGRGKTMQIEERVRLDARSQLVIVQIEGRRLVLSTHTHDAARLVLELSPRALGAPAAEEAAE
ncbi:MAG TPA: flagellar biosynthetic protein FliO [Polyangiales bacterium]